MMQVMKSLIRIRRERMTSSEAARRMGVSRQQAYNIERGYQGPSLRTVLKYAKAIGARLVVDDGSDEA